LSDIDGGSAISCPFELDLTMTSQRFHGVTGILLGHQNFEPPRSIRAEIE
jgi:hypothetical protein